MIADVCLFAEGTYPYVTGGVSAWTHDLIGSLPDIRFAIFHISARVGEVHEPVYRLPDNVVSVVDMGLHGGDESGGGGEHGTAATWQAVRGFHDQIATGTCPIAPLVKTLAPAPGRGVDAHEMLYGKSAWNVVRELYEARAPHLSFLDYFWTWRFTHLPMARLLHAAIPEARLYHAVATGWAGLAASIARARSGRPFLLTEHGLYARERRIDIDDADWIFQPRELPSNPGARFFFKEQWSKLFERLATIAYTEADVITTIFEGNRRAQIEAGADPAKTLVIPNGIDVERFARTPRVPPHGDEFRIGFVGRVVPIKDVRTFLRAVRIVVDIVPGARAEIVGPVDEDADYAAECRALVAALDLERHVEFTGRVNVADVYPNLDVIVLTSLSEGVPLVMLETGAAGLPTVATDVGACRELLEGREPDDRALGPSGLVTPVADAGATAAALIALARDRRLGQTLGETGRARVRRFYRASDLAARYRALYTRLLGS
jgi:glycosyltransferase involved in cell wall biosynthesis